MKRSFIKVAVVALVMAIACFVASCASSDVTSIAIEEANMPQTTFVQGNDPDLSGGKLTAYMGSKSKLVPLDSSGVSVSGYDKDKLGKQELTIKYSGKTTKLNVNTVARMTADESVTKYFVGEEFAESGAIRITRDNGKAFTADISDPEVTVSGFSSAAAGKTTVAVTYESDTERYSSTLAVTVYNIASTSMQRPSKIAYDSHEKLDLSGGRIIYRNDDNSFTRQIPITEEMVSGFNPGAATIDNRTAQTSLQQSLTVSYKGFTSSYNISIRFSNVSLVWLRADELSDIDWTNPATMPTAVQAEKAREAFEAYCTLSAANKTLISEEDLKAVVRPAAVYFLKMWNEELDGYSTFSVSETGFSIADEEETSYALAKADLEKFNRDKSDLYGYAQILFAIKTESSTKDITVFEDGEQTVAEYLSQVASEEEIDEVVPDMLGFMTKLYECFMNVGSTWSDDIMGLSESVASAYDLFDREYKKAEDLYFATGKMTVVMLNSRMLCRYVSSWRSGNDLFDMIFSYYNAFDEEHSAEALIKMTKVASNFGLPLQLENLYNDMHAAFLQRELLYAGDTYDTTLFSMFYRRVVTYLDEVAENGDTLYSDLCGKKIFAFDVDLAYSAYETADILAYGDYGYLDTASAAVGVQSVKNLWDFYLDIMDTLYDNDMNYGELNKQPEFGQKIEQYLKMFIDLTPTEQLIFLTSLDTRYRDTSNKSLEFDYIDGDDIETYTYFTFMIGLHYSEKLSSAEHAVFNSYLLAVEEYARRSHFESSTLNTFKDSYAAAKARLAQLQDEERANVIEYGGDIIAECERLEQMHDTTLPGIQLGAEDERLIEELKAALSDLNTVGFLMTNTTQPYELQSAYYAAYEVAYELARQIAEGSSQDLLTVYQYGEDSITSAENAARYNFDYLVMFYFRTNFFSYMREHRGVFYQGKNRYLYNIYESAGIKDFLKQSKSVMMVYANYLRYGTVSDDINSDEIASVLESYFALSPDMQAALMGTDNPGQSFYRGLVYYYTNAFGWDMDAEVVNDGVILAFINATRYLAVCKVDMSEETLELLTQAHETLVDLYEALESADRQLFDGVFGTYYQNYIEGFNELTQD